LRALVVDDSRPTRNIIAKMMRDLEFETTEFASGREALEHLDGGARPDVVTVNWNMPDMDGLELVQAIRRRVVFRQLPVLMISGESTQERISLALASDISAYITKPCTPRRIAEELLRLGFKLPNLEYGAALAAQQPASATSATDTPDMRVMIVDDSSTVRRMISSTLDKVDRIRVVGAAANGREALEQIKSFNPDVILLDVEMPQMDGLETLREMRTRLIDIPVLMFSSKTHRGAATATEALLLGAKDFVFKPGGTEMNDPEAGRTTLLNEVVPKLRALYQSRTRRLVPPTNSAMPRLPTTTTTTAGMATQTADVELVVIGSSTGGPAALLTMLSDPLLKSSLFAPMLIVQHMPELFTMYLAKRLAESTRLDVAEAVAGEVLQPGMIRLAPGGVHHLQVRSRGGGLVSVLASGPPVNSCRPSADVLFQSAAQSVGGGTLGVILTGIGQDGTEGCRSILEKQGQVIAQDQQSSAVWGMPGSVVAANLAGAILPLELIGPEIARRLANRQRK
jgi:two-component system, chemotaxis family, protein-glutamate methylesterase/glutaminase